MPFLQLSFEAQHAEADLYSDLLSEFGALAVTLEDAKDTPLFEPPIGTTPLWGDTKVIALFEFETNIPTLKNKLEIALTARSFNTLTIASVNDEDWVRKSLDQFKPMCFGNKLWICPSWCEIPNDPDQPTLGDAITVFLDPGLAFGTGTHPTTQLCLEWLAEHPPSNQKVLDYGCGSGILGVAALKLGAKEMYAVDHDPQALDSTTENAKLNGFYSPEILLFSPDDFEAHVLEQNARNETNERNNKQATEQQFDLILANILAEPLLQLAEKFSNYIKPNGRVVLSGILGSQINSIIKAYEPWFTDFQVKHLEEWVRIEIGGKSPNPSSF